MVVASGSAGGWFTGRNTRLRLDPVTVSSGPAAGSFESDSEQHEDFSVTIDLIIVESSTIQVSGAPAPGPFRFARLTGRWLSY